MLYAISERLSTEARAALLSEIVSDEAWLGDSEGTHDAQELAQVVAGLALDELRMRPQRIRPAGQDVAYVASEIAEMLHIDPDFVGGLAEECFNEGLFGPKVPDPRLVAMFEQLGQLT